MSMQYLSLHIIFSIKVDIRQYQECIQNGQNMNFDFFAPEFGALPILQDCPLNRSRHIKLLPFLPVASDEPKSALFLGVSGVS